MSRVVGRAATTRGSSVEAAVALTQVHHYPVSQIVLIDDAHIDDVCDTRKKRMHVESLTL